MDRVDVTQSLPQDLVERARSPGLLSEKQVEQWLNEELDRKHNLDRFFGKLDRLAEIEPSITPQEIDTEIEAYRRENRQRKQDELGDRAFPSSTIASRLVSWVVLM